MYFGPKQKQTNKQALKFYITAQPSYRTLYWLGSPIDEKAKNTLQT